MQKNAHWIWYYGDYEIFLIKQVCSRRELRKSAYPAFWKFYSPNTNVRFFKRVDCCKESFLQCCVNGEGFIKIDDKNYPVNTLIKIDEGSHYVEIHASNTEGLPAIFVESDVCPSDRSWFCDNLQGNGISVGGNPLLCSPNHNVEEFPFKYRRCDIKTFEEIDDGVLYDFGNEMFGFLNIQGADPDDNLLLSYGESREEALDFEYSEITDEVLGCSTYRLRQRAFRYVYIRNSSKMLTVWTDFEYLPLSEEGTFVCNTELINNIYSAAVHTFHLNCREFFLDGIKRDRWVWSGDAYQSARINRYLFADKDIEQRTIIGLAGKAPVVQPINTILDYSLLWILTVYEHYVAYGDKSFLKSIFPMVECHLAFCETRLNSDGFLEGFKKDWIFIDWSEIDKTGAVSAEQVLLIAVYNAMAELSTVIFGNDRGYFIKALELKKRFTEFYWNEEKGAFIDSYASGRNQVTRHANIFAVMYDVATEEQSRSILENVLLCSEVRPITTPYFKGYEMDAMAKLGRLTDVENEIISYWGGMIKLGAKTIWEEYDPAKIDTEHFEMYGGKYSKSLCHAWGAGPIYIFGRYYLGVYATKPGYETFNVEPNLGGLAQIEGVVPIGDGTVSVKSTNDFLTVTSSKKGGTLIWRGKKYSLHPNIEVKVEK